MSDVTLFTFGFMVFMIALTGVILYGYELFWVSYRRDERRV
ncbi:MAG: hypothetical protein Q8P41_28715 [Pseudomonadota bacterium]|nr:hypothetical protein [Pseudomonadota bacterium]